MATGEVPNRTPENTRRGINFCEDIRHAVELRELSTRLDRKAWDVANKVVHGSMFDELPFRLGVTIPEGVEAYVVNDISDDITDTEPKSFTATEIREISQHGVEFLDRITGNALRIKGYNFEVYPVFPEEPVEPLPEV